MKKEVIIDIFKDIGQVIFATILISPIFTASKADWSLIVGGFIASLYFWILSFTIAK